MTIYEMARALGEELAKTSQAKNLAQAKAAYQQDKEIVATVEAYTALYPEYQQKRASGSLTEEENEIFMQKVAQTQEAIKNSKTAQAMYHAEKEFNDLVQSIYTLIYATTTGEDVPGGCSGSCSGCGGCHERI